jgi:peptidyl-prolyl cis-trans isomerase A (cyclophilin A)
MSVIRNACIPFVLLISWPLLAQQSAPETTAPAQTAPPASTQSAPAASSQLPDAPGAAIHPGPQPTGATVLFDTSMGQMTCRLFDKQAPEAVANFVGLATGTKEFTDPATKKKTRRLYYDGTTFHRVIPGFMIQGGDPLGTGEGDPGYVFNDEVDPALNFDVPGRLAMANSGPNTNGSQFFVTEVPTDFLDQKYVIFGQCDDASVEVVKAIARVNRDSNDKPLEAVVLRKVTVIPAGQPVPAAPPAAPTGLQATPQF